MTTMHTRFEIPAELHHRLKCRAAVEQKTLTKLLAELLEAAMQPPAKHK